MSTKEVLLELAQKLPPNATLGDAISQLRQKEDSCSGGEQTLAELEEYRRAGKVGVDFESPAWHGEVLAERMAKYERGEGTLLTVDELFERVRQGRK